jgi:hypothetical protein
MSAFTPGRREESKLLRHLAGQHSPGNRFGGLKMPKGLLKLMLMGLIGFFFGAAIAGYALSI